MESEPLYDLKRDGVPTERCNPEILITKTECQKGDPSHIHSNNHHSHIPLNNHHSHTSVDNTHSHIPTNDHHSHTPVDNIHTHTPVDNIHTHTPLGEPYGQAPQINTHSHGTIACSDATHNARHHANHSKSLFSTLISAALADSSKRPVLYFFALNLSFMVVQLLYAFRSHSLGLLSDSLHMALDCLSIAAGILASILACVEPSLQRPFGVRHIETLAGFGNGTLLFGVIAEILLGAVSRLWSPVTIRDTTELLVVSTLGLGVNVVGAVALSGTHSHSHGGTPSHSHSHGEHHAGHAAQCSEDAPSTAPDDTNMRGIFLHVMADLLGSVGVVVSTLLIKYFHWPGFDPLASLFIAWLLIGHSGDLFKSAGKGLLLSVDATGEAKVREVLKDLCLVPGVSGHTTPRFWPERDQLVGYIHVQYYPGENSTIIKKRVERVLLLGGILKVWVQVEARDESCWCR